MTAHVAETPAEALDRADLERTDGPSDIHPIVDVIRRTTQVERQVRTSRAGAATMDMRLRLQQIRAGQSFPSARWELIAAAEMYGADLVRRSGGSPRWWPGRVVPSAIAGPAGRGDGFACRLMQFDLRILTFGREPLGRDGRLTPPCQSGMGDDLPTHFGGATHRCIDGSTRPDSIWSGGRTVSWANSRFTRPRPPRCVAIGRRRHDDPS